MSESLSVEHFRNILTNETKNLNKLCERWSKVLEENGNSCQSTTEGDGQNDNNEDEEFFGAIRTTIGQAKLLMSQRFKQFNDLIDHCEFNTGQMPTRLNDLSGFWEMISFQVEDVMKKFNKLEAVNFGEYDVVKSSTKAANINIMTNNNNNNNAINGTKDNNQ